eukprot:58700_1
MIDSDTDWKEWCSQNCPDTQLGLTDDINIITTTKSPTSTGQTHNPTKAPTTTDNPTESPTAIENPTESPTATDNPTASNVDNNGEKLDGVALSSLTNEQINAFLNSLTVFIIFIAVIAITICIVGATYVYKNCYGERKSNTQTVQGVELHQIRHQAVPTDGADDL